MQHAMVMCATTGPLVHKYKQLATSFKGRDMLLTFQLRQHTAVLPAIGMKCHCLKD